MKHKIGDIVRFRFSNNLSAVVSGYGVGKAFAPYFHFAPEDDIVLATRENGTVIVFKDNNTDWEVVGHVDMTDCITKIMNAKEI